MTILSTVCTKLLCTNAHLGRRVTFPHIKVYTCGFRNGIAILDSDKTLICLRNAIHFIGSLIRKKGRSFFLKTNHFFIYSIMEKMWSCINDSQWKIRAFLTNSYANPKKFRSRKNQINFGLNQQPDCVVILHPDRKSSVILEADRSLIPIASLVDSTIPWEFYKRINYPIPANDPILFVYLFRNSITKTVILERKRITAMNRPEAGARVRFYSSASHSSQKDRGRPNPLFLFLGIIFTIVMVNGDFISWWTSMGGPWITELLSELAGALAQWLAFLPSLLERFRGNHSATLGGMGPSCSEGETALKEEETSVHHMDNNNSPDWNALSPIQEIPSTERGEVAPNNPVPAGPAAPQDIEPLIPNAKGKIYFNLTTLYGSMDPKQATELTDIIFDKKEKILEELRSLDSHSPVNSQILWQDAGDTIRDPQSGGEYQPLMLDMILESLQKYGRGSDHYKRFLNEKMHSIKNADLENLQRQNLPMDKLNSLNQAKFVRWPAPPAEQVEPDDGGGGGD
jgi:ribosomal protein S2